MKAFLTALETVREIGIGSTEALILYNLAELYYCLDNINQAKDFCIQALLIATDLGIPLQKKCQDLMKQLENND